MSSMLGVLKYISNRDKTFYNGVRLTTGVNCNYSTGFAEMKLTKQQFKKDNGRQFYQFIQSFSPNESISPMSVHELGIELSQKLFPNFEVMVATHCNKDHLHNHIVVNSVSFKDGKKLHQNHDTLVLQRKINDEICLSHSLSVLPKYEKQNRTMAMKSREYHSAVKGNSWKLQLMQDIDDCMKFAKTKERFIELMESENYQVTWKENLKYITYTLPDGKKCRDNKLHEDKYLKERMEQEFEFRKEIYTRRTETDEQEVVFVERRNDKEPFQQSGSNMERITTDSFNNKKYTSESLQFTNRTKLSENSEYRKEIRKDRTDLITGWEEERKILYSFEIQDGVQKNIDSSYFNDSFFSINKMDNTEYEELDRINNADEHKMSDFTMSL